MKKLFVFNLSYLTFIFLIISFFSCSKYDSKNDPPKIWGQLEQGPYSVGFKTKFLYDISRSAIPYSDWDGKLYPSSETEGRQMQINIWYPAKVTKKSKRLHFDHYVNLLGQQTDFGNLDENKKDFASQQIIKKINALGGNGAFTVASLDSLKKLKTHAFLEAEVVEEKFPLVVFPNGCSPAFQSIMCEYLASSGFIVAAVALKGVNQN